MCELLKEPSRIAKKDIIVYKTVIRYKSAYLPRHNYTNMYYELNKIYTSKLSYSWRFFNKLLFYKALRSFGGVYFDGDGIESKTGLYSFSEFKYANRFVYIKGDDVVLKCIIPKGSTFFRFKHGYISNKLITIQEVL